MKQGWTLLGLLFLFGCNGSENKPGPDPDPGSGPVKGYFYEESELNTGNRIRVRKGNDLSVKCRFSHESGPKGASDRDSGSDFYIQFLKPEEIHAGKRLDIRDTSILVYLVNWFTPSGHKVITQDDLAGQIEVTGFSEKKMTLRVTIDSATVEMNLSKSVLD